MSSSTKTPQPQRSGASASSSAIVQDKRELSKALFILGPATMVLGLVLLAAMIFQLSRADQTQDWLETEGVITSHRVTRSFVGTRSSTERANYIPRATFTYQVNGQRFTGQQYTIGASMQTFPTALQARGYLRKEFPEGGRMAVYYNPRDPQDAVLKRGGGGNLKWITVAAVLITLLGLWLVWTAVRLRRTALKLSTIAS
jgi:hypothetical protein